MSIRTKPSTPAYAEGWDRIFGKPKPKPAAGVSWETVTMTEKDFPGWKDYLSSPAYNGTH